MHDDPPAERRHDLSRLVSPGAVRFARATDHYEETVSFYRDLVGLPVLADFVGSFGEDGTVFGIPDSAVQLEVVRARQCGDSDARPFEQLVIYLDGPVAVSKATSRLDDSGVPADSEPHPYWAANGAVSYRDPDGRDVVFAPWVFGRDPDPVDRECGRTVPPEQLVAWFDGDREQLRSLFEEAGDSRAQLASYIGSGRVLAAWHGADIVGHLQLVPTGREQEVELKSMAVVAARRGIGIGRTLIEAAVRLAAEAGSSRMVVATAAADVGNLRFYQRCGFRLTTVERDAFTPATAYPDPVVIDGIPMRDRVWLAQDLTVLGSA